MQMVLVLLLLLTLAHASPISFKAGIAVAAGSTTGTLLGIPGIAATAATAVITATAASQCSCQPCCPSCHAGWVHHEESRLLDDSSAHLQDA